MEIVHRSGNKHGNGLSRIPDELEYCDHYETGKHVKSLPCGGCKYCQRAHSQWNRFDDEVDNVVPLSIRSVGTGFNSDEQLIERYTAAELRGMQLKDPTLLQLITWKEEPKEPTENEIMTQGPKWCLIL